MNQDNIVLIKLYNGEMLIGNRFCPDLDTTDQKIWSRTYLKDPRQLVIVPTMTGDAKVVMGSVCHPFKVKRLEDEIYINTTQIMFTLEESEIDTELVNAYKSEVSGIAIASASQTAALNGNASGGDFVL